MASDIRPGIDRPTLEELWARWERERLALATLTPSTPTRGTKEKPPHRSALLDFYAAEANVADGRKNRRERQVTIPPTFSFIDAPDEALASLEEVVYWSRRSASRLRIDQRRCTDLDLCAGSVLVALGLEARGSLRTRLSGYLPIDGVARDIVLATGFPRVLKLRFAPRQHFKVLDPIHGPNLTRRKGKLHVPDFTIASDRLTDYITACYAAHGVDFSSEQGRLAKLLTEVLENAEIHGGDRHGWWVAGYLRHPDGEAYGDCHIAIFNFGRTLSQTLRDIQDSSQRSEIEGLVRAHASRGLFERHRERWTEDDLWTLYALQEGVTRFYGVAGTRRGAGTALMISAFQDLGRTASGDREPKMSVTSGKTHIVFDGRYRMALKDGRRVIAFNDANELMQAPAQGTVMHLKRHFPGTVISLRFFIDPKQHPLGQRKNDGTDD